MAVGRKPKLTPAVQQRLVQAVTAGAYFEVACEAAGISRATGYEWIARGCGQDKDRPRTPLYADFADAIEKAHADAELLRVARIAKAAQGGQLLSEKIRRTADGEEIIERRYSQPQWQADAWWLERRYPARWGRQERPAPPADEPETAAVPDNVIVIKASQNGTNGVHG
jgi:hypothetical protein